MKYKTLKVDHYQVLTRQQFSFSEGLNILLGANESGKSSIIACLMATIADFDKQQRANFALSTLNEWHFSVHLNDGECDEITRKLFKTANQAIVSRGYCNGRKLLHYPYEDRLKFIVDTALWHIKPISHDDFAVFSRDDLWQNWLIKSQMPSNSQHPQVVIEQLNNEMRNLYTKHTHSKSAIAKEDRLLKSLYEQKRQLMVQRDDKLAQFNSLFSKRAEIDRLSSQRQKLISQRDCVQRDTPLYQLLTQRDELQKYTSENDSKNKRQQSHLEDYLAADLAYDKAQSALTVLDQRWRDVVTKTADYHNRLQHDQLLTLELNDLSSVTNALRSLNRVMQDQAAYGQHQQMTSSDDNQHQTRHQQLDRYLASQQRYDQLKHSKQRSLFTFVVLSCIVAGMIATVISAWHLAVAPTTKWLTVGFIALATTTLVAWLISVVRWRIIAIKAKRQKSAIDKCLVTDLAWANLPTAGENNAAHRTLSVEQTRQENDRQLAHYHLMVARDQAIETLRTYHLDVVDWLDFSTQQSPEQLDNYYQAQLDYRRHINEKNRLSTAINQAKRELGNCQAKRDNRRQILFDIYGEIKPEQIREIANHHQLIWQQLATLDLQLAPHQLRIDQIRAVADLPTIAQLDDAIAEIDDHLNRSRRKLGQLEGRLELHPDDQLEMINCQIDETLLKRQQLIQQYDEKLLVQAVVKQIHQRLNAANQPEFIRLAKYLLQQLSAGFIKDISLSTDKRVLLDEGLSDGQLQSDQLSYGAANLINFALRIAILEHYDPQGTLPLFIDDATSVFDTARQHAAQVLIVQLAKRRQVFFTATTLEQLEVLTNDACQIIRLTRKNSD